MKQKEGGRCETESGIMRRTDSLTGREEKCEQRGAGGGEDFFSFIFIGGRTKEGILLKVQTLSHPLWTLGYIVHTQTHIPVIPRPLLLVAQLSLFNQPESVKAKWSEIKRSKEETFVSNCFFKHGSKSAV